MYQVHIHTHNLSPFRYRALNVINRDNAISPHVAALRLPQFPPAVGRLIAAIVVDALDAVVARWALAHVAKECREIIPLFTYSDPASAVAMKPFVVGVPAALKHLTPNPVFGRFCLAVREPRLFLQATT